jgi:hypothetical protein
MKFVKWSLQEAPFYTLAINLVIFFLWWWTHLYCWIYAKDVAMRHSGLEIYEVNKVYCFFCCGCCDCPHDEHTEQCLRIRCAIGFLHIKLSICRPKNLVYLHYFFYHQYIYIYIYIYKTYCMFFKNLMWAYLL